MTTSAARYEPFEDHAECILVLDAAARLRYANAAARAVVGPALPFGASWIESWDGEDRIAAERAVAAARNGGFGRFEGAFSHAEATTWWDVVVFPFCDAPSRDEFIVVAHDITTRRRRRDALVASEGFYRAIASALTEKVWVAGRSGAFEYVNAAWTRFTGLDLPASIGRGWLRAVHPDDIVAAKSALHSAALEKREFERDLRLHHASDGYRWHSVRGAPVIEDGSYLGIVGSFVDIHDRKRSVDALRFLANAQERISFSLDVDVTLRTIAEMALPELGDWCVTYLRREGGSLEAAAFAHIFPSRRSELQGLYLGRTIPDGDPIARVIATREPYVFRRGPLDDDQLGLRGAVVVPLVEGDRTLGAISFAVDVSERDYDDADVAFAQIYARFAAAALNRARIYEREHNIAATLQDAILPKELPRMDGFDFDAIYVAARAEATVGGDWYDAFTLPDGRIAITLGDVMGSGLRAAVTMSRLRQSMQSVAMVQPFPNAMLDSADLTLRASETEGIATALAGIFDPLNGSFSYASAGHPSPLLARADGGFVEFVGSGLPLGLRTRDEPGTTSIHVGPGSVLVLYTDGLVESTRDIEEGDQRLRAALLDPGVRTSPGLATAIFERVLFDGSNDDVAILTLRAAP